MSLTNMANMGRRERDELIAILQAWNDGGLPEDFSTEAVQAAFNTHSGLVFLTNADFQAAILRDGALESFYTSPYAGREGTFAELAAEYTDMDGCDAVWFRELAESLGRTSEVPDVEQATETADEEDDAE
ncbi:serine/threonine kinase [Burkholderia phage BcepSauron]|uniref:Serine/threonine kinase n=1 Tax=Burkholderia phage BcepSauron TaxID=2530033 RepID=A0A482MLB2_9CAUD|nr:serine/threonine kinase [Burkholderia phage BcepSauron]QBQ74439.1 serine/threonine kinase [Burkholderia phage BcepSauron]